MWGDGYLEGAHFVEDAAEGPEVGAVAVGLVVADLGGEVEGGADAGDGGGVLEYLGDAEVADFEGVVLGEEDVGGLEVPVEDVLGMENPDPEEQLREPVADDLFVEALVVALEVLDVGGQVALWIGRKLPSQYSMMMMSSF